MTAPNWNRIKDLLHEALERPVSERTAFLDTACNDATTRREVEALLAAHERAEAAQALESPFAHTSDLEPDADPDPAITGQQVGPYHLVHELGRGGMGTVYLAERADGQFTHQVALKVVRRGLDTDDILSRFRYERQILASLDHPHIAHLLDGGLTDDGRPYFAMEYVDGVSIIEYADAHRLTTPQRLALFRTVCRAVQYAHQNLVVHRDLKPSNILVTPEGTVKLLDFGIAKLLSEETEHTVPHTRTGLRLMTPEYAAPEQIKGEAITTATDVYQLGVLLYELLTGHRPYRLSERMRHEIERVILEEEPTRPSTAIKHTAAVQHGTATTRLTPESISAARSTNADTLQRRLAGDLDTIVLMALKKDPGRRYASAEQLADDIRRHLNNLPVTARPDSVGYRASKFVRRHKTSVLAGATVVVALLGGIATTAWQAYVADAERDRAQTEAAKAEQINVFLQDMLAEADPVNTGRDVKVADVLDKAAGQIDSTMADQPDVAAALKNTIGVTYRSLGLYDESEVLLRQSLAARRSLHPEPHPDVVRSLTDLSHLSLLKSDYAASESLLTEALAMSRTLYEEKSSEIAFVLSELATVNYYEGNYEQAEALQREALDIEQATLGQDHMDVAVSLNNLAALRAEQGDPEEAESLFRQALAIKRKLKGDHHIEVAWTLHDLAATLQDLGQLQESETMYREALAIRRDALGEHHRDYIVTLSSLTSVLVAQEKKEEAEQMMREAVTLTRNLWDEPHPLHARTLNSLGNFLREQGATEEASDLLQESVAVWRATVPTHPYAADAFLGWGQLLLDTHQPQRAEPLLREALAIRTTVLPADHWKVAQVQSALGACLTDLRRYAEAEPLLKTSYATLEKERGPDQPETQRARRYLAHLYEAWDKPEQAVLYRATASNS